MFRLWGKMWESNHLIKDISFDYLEIQVIEED